MTDQWDDLDEDDIVEYNTKRVGKHGTRLWPWINYNKNIPECYCLYKYMKDHELRPTRFADIAGILDVLQVDETPTFYIELLFHVYQLWRWKKKKPSQTTP